MENLENKIPEEENIPQEVVSEIVEEPIPVEEIPVVEEAVPAAEETIEEAPVDEVIEEIPREQPKRVSPYADSPYVMADIPQAPVKQKKKKAKRGGFWKTAICAVLVLALVGGACFVTARQVNGYWEGRYTQMQLAFQSQIEDLEAKIGSINPGISVSGSPLATADGLTPAQVYAMNVDSVVMIHNKITSGNQTGTATGSGFILTEDGYVVTNHHVIEGDGALSVGTTDGKIYPATLVGSDQTNDVALLKIEATGLQAAKLGSSNALIVGDQVVAIGNPLGELTSTLTVGYISAKERDVNTDGFAINMLQTDAAINSGNSGGPLFNMKGEVVGITTAKYSGTSSGGASIEGVGFAIPIDDVAGMLSDLASYGYVTGAYLGVMVSDMDPSAATLYGLPMGAYVQEATPGYAAAKAGVQEKDIIVALGDIQVSTVSELTKALRNFSAGEQTTITVFRSGREMKLTIVLDAKPGQ